MPRKLIDIDTDEISLVDKAANRKKFAFKKENSMDPELIALFKSIGMEDPTEQEIAKAKELSAEATKAIKGALNILSKYKDDMPPDVLTAIKTLTKYASYGYPEKKESEELSKEAIEKIGARLSKATLEELQKIKGLLDGVDTKALRKVQDLINELIKGATVEKKYDALPEDVRKRLAKLDSIEEADEAEKAKLEKADKEKIDGLVKGLDDFKKEFSEKLDKLAKARGFKKSLDGQEDVNLKKEEEGDLWPSLKIGG